MKLIPLSLETATETGANWAAYWSHEDLTETTANTAQVLTFPIAARMSAQVVQSIIDVPLEDESDNAFNTTTLIVGDGDNDDALLTSQELNVNGSEVPLKRGTGTVTVYTESDTIDLTFGSMAAKSLSNLDKGRGHVLLNIQDARVVAPAV